MEHLIHLMYRRYSLNESLIPFTVKFSNRLVRAREVHKRTAWINDPCEDNW